MLILMFTGCVTAQAPRAKLIPIAAMTQDVQVLYGDPGVQGTLYFGTGDQFDRAAMTKLEAGGYAFIPKGTTMFGFTPDTAIVQVPWRSKRT